MLLSGSVSSQEELEFLFAMADPEFQLPLTPIWDLGGGVFNNTEVGTALSTLLEAKSAANRTIQRGLFNPTKWTVPSDKRVTDLNADVQAKAKAVIFQRVLPQLRGRSLTDVKDVIEQIANKDDSYAVAGPNERATFPFTSMANPKQANSSSAGDFRFGPA